MSRSSLLALFTRYAQIALVLALLVCSAGATGTIVFGICSCDSSSGTLIKDGKLPPTDYPPPTDKVEEVKPRLTYSDLNDNTQQQK